MTAPEPEVVTPERAVELMRQASVNYVTARLDGQRVMQYAREMAAGEWGGSRVSILPFADGKLVDGVNWLLAVEERRDSRASILPFADGKLVDGINWLMAVVLSGATPKSAVIDAAQPDICNLANTASWSAWHSGPRLCDLPVDNQLERS